jgi:hypothetical protein
LTKVPLATARLKCEMGLEIYLLHGITPVIRQYWLVPAGHGDGSAEVVGPAAGDCARGRGRQLEALVRKAAARTDDELWSSIGRLPQAHPPAKHANCLNHCGYGSTQSENG